MKRKIALVIAIFLALIFFYRYSILKAIYPLEYSDYIYKYAKQYNVDPMLAAAVIKAESNFDEKAKSSSGACGLMQITPDTAKWAAKEMGIADYKDEMLFYPEFNIRMGCWYINNLDKEFNDKDLMLAAYNGGRGRVKKWLEDNKYSENGKDLSYIPFTETDKYVKRVNVNYKMYKKLYNKKSNS